MKRIIAFFIALLPVLTIHAQRVLAPSEFQAQLDATHPQLLDVRTAGEYQSGHLKNALQADWLKKDEFAARVQYLDKTKPVLVYCASGVRSAAATKWMTDNGFSSVDNLKGGITSWKMEGRPVEAAASTAQMTTARYRELSRSAGVVLVDFGAEWCPPCKKMEPVLAQVQGDLKGKFTFVKVDGGTDIDVMKSEKVETLPVFIIYRDGRETWRKQGIVSAEELKEHLQ